jgi:hypothetical protein
MLTPVSLSDRAQSASLIIQGEVVQSTSYWNPQGNFIYTSHLLRVNEIVRGQLSGVYLEIVTDGGEVGLSRITVEPALVLAAGDKGIFFLSPVSHPAKFSAPVFRVFSDRQGFVKFSDRENKARDPFNTYAPIQDVYDQLGQILGIKLNTYPVPAQPGSKFNPSGLYSITGISPTNISAGTFSVLTITGSGFGSTRGTSFVEFENADDGGSTYIQPHSSQYVSWSGTQIQVMVPTRTGTTSGTAGTGQIRVTVGTSTLSTQTLTVDYGHLNVYYSSTNLIYNTRHQGQNGTGMTWNMYTGFSASTTAKASFERAFETWRCATFINWQIGSTVSTNTIASDGVNVIRFDVGTELPSGVLGRCTSYFSGCITGTVVNWFVDELDIVFDDGVNWQYGPTLATGTQYDFESVALHELGHGHQLSHVINSADVMHYSLSNAQNKRSLITQNINAGNAVMVRNVSAVCGNSVMAALTATNCSLGTALTASFNLTSSTVCAGTSVSLTSLSTGATGYTWTMAGGNPSSSSSQNTATTYSASGTFSITLLVSNGSSTASITKTLSVIANPTVAVTSVTICAGSQATLTSSGAGTYNWVPGNLTGSVQVINPSSTTVYTVTGTLNGCTASAQGTVTVSPSPTVTALNAAICSGNSTLVTASGATGFTWQPGNLTGASQNLSPAATTSYTITGATGSCSDTHTITVTVSNTPTLSVPAAAICAGTSTLLTASGASAYTWNPGTLTGASQNLSPASTMVYTITGSNAGCSASVTTTVSVNSSVTINVPSALICNGSSTLLTATGATSYTWNPGNLNGASQTLNPSATTVYTINGTTGSCSGSRTTTVTVVATPTVSVPEAIICAGSSTVMSASGATSYTWNPGGLTGSSQNLNPPATTAYTVTGSTSGCAGAPEVFTITVNPSPTLALNNAVICSGGSTVLTASGATSYTWNPGSLTGATQTLSPSSTTAYTITGALAGCSSTIAATVSVNTIPTVNISNATICTGGSTLLTASGATSYTWQPGNLSGASQNLSPAATTIYTITGSNGACQSASAEFTVAVTSTIALTVADAAICTGGSTVLTVSGASNYTWQPGNVNGATQTLNPASTTVYTISGSAGTCTASATSTVSITPGPSLSATGGSVCSGSSFTLSASGATTFTWQPGAHTGPNPVVNPTSSTIYTVTGENTGCISTETAAVTVAADPTVTVSGNPAPLCRGSCSTLTPVGAQTYTFLNGPGTVVCPTLTTTYSVTGTSSLGCESTLPGTVTIVVNNTPNISVVPTTPSVCIGSSITVSAIGGTSYTWAPGNMNGNSQQLSPSVTTVYSITGQNAFGCRSVRTITVTAVPLPTVSATASSGSICTGNSATLTASGATSFTWMPGNITTASFSASPTSSTDYTITGRTAGCNDTETLSITVNPRPVVGVTAASGTLCQGICTTLSPTGAVSYTVTPGLSTSVCPSVTTTYSVNGTNSFGCDATTPATVSVVVNATPNISFSPPSPTLCSGNSVNVTASGATNFSWMPGSLNGGSQNLSPGTTLTYTVTGESLGCARIVTVAVNVTTTPTVSVNGGSICSGASTILTASGATNYSWNPGNLSGASQNLNPAATTVYTVTGANGSCPGAPVLRTLTVVTTPTVSVNSGTLCSGNSTLITAGGAAAFVWQPGSLTGASQNLAPLSTTVYTVTGNNSTCTDTETFVINVTVTPTVSVNSGSICSGASTLVTASGASTYSWNPGNLSGASQNLGPAATTVYSVTGFNGTCPGQQRTLTLTVVTTPTVTVANATLCSGNSTVVTASGASVIVWNPGSMSGATQTLSPMVTTVYTVTGNNSTCVHSRTMSVNVTITPTVSANNATLCSGNSVTLAASGASTYVWQPGNLTGATQTFTPPSTSGVQITGYNGTCPSAIRTISLSVFPTPTVAVLSSSMCSGTSAVLTASGAVQYTWMPGNLSGSVQTVSPSITTIYTITGMDLGCYNTRTVAVTVVQTPTVSVPNATLCSGLSTVVAASGASVFAWAPGNLAGSSQTLSPLVTTVYTVTGNNSTCTDTETMAVNVTITPTVSAAGAVICSGNSTVLAANGAPTFTWLPMNIISPTVSVLPSSTSVYTVVGQNGACLGTPLPVSVTVNTTPTVTIPSTSLCSGKSVTVTAGGATTYTFEPGTMTGATQTLNPGSTTIYTVSGTLGNCGSSSQFTVLVHTTPTVSVASASICSGASTVLTASGAGSYSWAPGPLTGATQTLNPGVTTVYTITGEDTPCLSAPVKFTVDVTTQPTVTASGSVICAGETVTLVASGANTFTWNTTANDSIVVTLSNTTTYTLSGKTGICSDTALVTVVVKPLPVISVTASAQKVCVGEPVTISVSGAQNFSMNPGAVTSSIAVFNPVADITFTITGESNGCYAQGYTTVLVDPCTGIAETGPEGLVIYPHPAQNVVHLNFTQPFTGNIRIYGAAGQVLHNVRAEQTTELTLRLSEYAKGMYLLQMEPDNGKPYNRKLIRN